LYSGFTFLVLDIAVNLTRLGLEDRLVAGIVGVGAGALMFGLGITVARRREAIMARYTMVRGWEW
jgi:hypothetical protein